MNSKNLSFSLIDPDPIEETEKSNEVTYDSLVNLVNGEISWFNGYYRSFGDVRDVEKARETVNKLFEEFPG